MKKYILLIFILGFSLSNGQNTSFITAGASLSRVTASSNSTSIKLLSGVKTGMFIGVGKEFNIYKNNFLLQTNIKIIESGGKINNYIPPKTSIPDFLEKYRYSSYKLTVYHIDLETNFVYKTDFIKLYVGLKPSIIFYGKLTEDIQKRTSPSSPPSTDSGNNTTTINDNLVNNYSIISMKGVTGFALFPFKKKFFLDFGYHFNITSPVSLNLEKMKVNLNQKIFLIGLGYHFNSKKEKHYNTDFLYF